MRGKANTEKIKNLLSRGITDVSELSKHTGLSLNRVYEIRKALGYKGQRKKAQKKPQKQAKTEPKTPQTTQTPKAEQEPQIEPETTQTTHGETGIKKHIPSKNGNHPYIERRILNRTDFSILDTIYKSRKPLLIVGDTGTGKTHCISHFSFKKGLPILRTNLNGGTTPDELIGHWIPDEKEKGGFKWVDGNLTRFVREGGVFVCDEINSGNADILFFLHSLLDDDRQIVLSEKDGELIKAHPDFWFVATMNPDYEGTKPLNLALQDRFVILEFDYDNKVEKKLINNEKLLNFAEKIRVLFRKGELSSPLSTRTLIYYQNAIKDFGKEIAKILLFNKFKPDERQAIKEVFELELNNRKIKEKTDNEGEGDTQ